MKIVRIRSFSGPYFPAFRILISPCNRNAGKYGPEKLQIRTLSSRFSNYFSISLQSNNATSVIGMSLSRKLNSFLNLVLPITISGVLVLTVTNNICDVNFFSYSFLQFAPIPAVATIEAIVVMQRRHTSEILIWN